MSVNNNVVTRVLSRDDSVITGREVLKNGQTWSRPVKWNSGPDRVLLRLRHFLVLEEGSKLQPGTWTLFPIGWHMKGFKRLSGLMWSFCSQSASPLSAKATNTYITFQNFKLQKTVMSATKTLLINSLYQARMPEMLQMVDIRISAATTILCKGKKINKSMLSPALACDWVLLWCKAPCQESTWCSEVFRIVKQKKKKNKSLSFPSQLFSNSWHFFFCASQPGLLAKPPSDLDKDTTDNYGRQMLLFKLITMISFSTLWREERQRSNEHRQFYCLKEHLRESFLLRATATSQEHSTCCVTDNILDFHWIFFALFLGPQQRSVPIWDQWGASIPFYSILFYSGVALVSSWTASSLVHLSHDPLERLTGPELVNTEIYDVHFDH